MNCTLSVRKTIVVAAGVLLLAAASRSAGQANPYRGLWVGSVTLQAVNEVTVPLNTNNVPIASNPAVPTRTFDAAQLRIILHVNGAGQASLLKDVAILNRAYGTNGQAAAEVAARESDLALVTDPRTYAEYPPQPAQRIGSAVFDFGDPKATEALDAILESAAVNAAAFATNPALVVATQGARVQARTAAISAITPTLQNIASRADVADSFGAFLGDFNSAALNAIAADPSSSTVTGFLGQAEVLRDQSFYGDSRALDVVNAVVAAVLAAPDGTEPSVAHNMASSFADTANLYQRFVSGKSFGDMILAAAAEAAVAATAPGATSATILAALRATPAATTAAVQALQMRIPAYDDTRATGAIDAVLTAMAAAAFSNAALAPSEIRLRSETTGRDALSGLVARYPVPVLTPTLDYNAFIASAVFQAAPGEAAYAAADAAIRERADNPLYTPASLYAAAKLAAANALQSAYGAAARALRTELPLTGIFAPGSGDPRATGILAQPSDLGPPGLFGRLYLPANHPTNPFRHRRHRDHTTGFDIQRNIRFDFDGVSGSVLEPAAYGVDRIRGTYREEIFGLHKPLGPAPETAPIGLKTEGRFELNRISQIDSLNAR